VAIRLFDVYVYSSDKQVEATTWLAIINSQILQQFKRNILLDYHIYTYKHVLEDA